MILHNLRYRTQRMSNLFAIINYFYNHILKVIIIICMSLMFLSCKKYNSEVPEPLQEYLKNQGIQETIVDLDYSNSTIPDKKYISLTVTYNFSTSDGKPQKEFLGFILRMIGNEWKVDRNTTYTKSKTMALELLSGNLK